jgi:hypothetical protein
VTFVSECKCTYSKFFFTVNIYQCTMAEIFDDPWRFLAPSTTAYTDYFNIYGIRWARFKLNGINAVMATSSPGSTNMCGSTYPIYYSGKSPSLITVKNRFTAIVVNTIGVMQLSLGDNYGFNA